MLRVEAGIAHLTLNRPDRLNAIDLDMAQALAAAALQISHDRNVRVVLITGAGRAFCGGGDLKSFAATGDNLPGHLREVTTHLHAALTLLHRSDPPIVVGVQGSAAGAGLGLVCAADLVVAAETARFAFAYSAIGLTPDGGTSWGLPRLVGLRRAQELALTNRTIDAHEAMAMGLVTTVVTDAGLEPALDDLARSLAAAPTRALGVTKRLLRTAYDEPLEQRLAVEAAELSRSAATADGRAGIVAFLDKQTARFEGR